MGRGIGGDAGWRLSHGLPYRNPGQFKEAIGGTMTLRSMGFN